MRKLLFLLLFAVPVAAQTTINGRIMVGTYATGPGKPLPCSPGDQFNSSDNGAWLCGPAPNTWSPIGSGGGGGGGLTVQTNGVGNADQTYLNLLNSVSNAVGLTLGITNPAATGNDRFEISGLLNVTGGGTGRSNPTIGCVLVGEGSSPLNLICPAGNGTVLTSNGAGTDPSFQSGGGGGGGTPTYPVTIVNGVSGGIPYFSDNATESASGVMGLGQFMLGGGVGGAPTTSFATVPVGNGGVGVSNPTAHTVPVAEGNSPYTFISPGAAGLCNMSNGTGADPSYQTCPAASPGGSLHALQYQGAGSTFAGLASPTANGIYTPIYNIVAGSAVDPTTALSGVSTNAQTGGTYTYLYSDRFAYVTFSNSGAIAVTLPQANSTGFTSNWGNLSCDIGAGTATITPTTSTISVSTGNSYVSGASTLTLATGQCAWIFSNNTNYFAVRLGSIANTTATVGTTVVNANTCNAQTPITITGVTTASTFNFTPTTDTSGVTGWGSTGGLTIAAWPTSNTLNFKVCNQTGSGITPGGSVTFNVSTK